MMVTSRVFGLGLIRALFGYLLEQMFEPVAGAVDLFRELLLVALERRQLGAQPTDFLAQALAQPRGLLYLVFECGQLPLHRAHYSLENPVKSRCKDSFSM